MGACLGKPKAAHATAEVGHNAIVAPAAAGQGSSAGAAGAARVSDKIGSSALGKNFTPPLKPSIDAVPPPPPAVPGVSPTDAQTDLDPARSLPAGQVASHAPKTESVYERTSKQVPLPPSPLTAADRSVLKEEVVAETAPSSTTSSAIPRTSPVLSPVQVSSVTETGTSPPLSIPAQVPAPTSSKDSGSGSAPFALGRQSNSATVASPYPGVAPSYPLPTRSEVSSHLSDTGSTGGKIGGVAAAIGIFNVGAADDSLAPSASSISASRAGQPAFVKSPSSTNTASSISSAGGIRSLHKEPSSVRVRTGESSIDTSSHVQSVLAQKSMFEELEKTDVNAVPKEVDNNALAKLPSFVQRRSQRFEKRASSGSIPNPLAPVAAISSVPVNTKTTLGINAGPFMKHARSGSASSSARPPLSKSMSISSSDSTGTATTTTASASTSVTSSATGTTATLASTTTGPVSSSSATLVSESYAAPSKSASGIADAPTTSAAKPTSADVEAAPSFEGASSAPTSDVRKRLSDPLAVAISEDDGDVEEVDTLVESEKFANTSTASSVPDVVRRTTVSSTSDQAEKLSRKNIGALVPIKEMSIAEERAGSLRAPRANSIEAHVSKFESMKTGKEPDVLGEENLTVQDAVGREAIAGSSAPASSSTGKLDGVSPDQSENVRDFWTNGADPDSQRDILQEEESGSSRVLRNVSMFDTIAAEKKRDSDQVAASIASLKSSRSKPLPSGSSIGLARPVK